MKKVFFLCIICSLAVLGFVLAQKQQTSSITIEQRWKNVNDFAEKQLPESALKEVDKIIELAQKEKNSIQFIKASIYKMRFSLEKDPDQAPQLVREFEAYAKSASNQIDRELLNSMTAELYSNIYQRNAWNINRRTELKGFVPEDIQEWTSGNYITKITQLLEISSSDIELLQSTPALQYAELMNVGNESEELQPTLYDFLLYRKIEVLSNLANLSNTKIQFTQSLVLSPAKEFIKIKQDSTDNQSIHNEILNSFQQLLKFRTEAENIPALIYADIKRLEFFHNHQNIEIADELYLKSLDDLINKFKNDESVIEVYAQKANFYLNNFNKNTDNKNYRKIAYNISSEGIKIYPDYHRIGLLKNIKESILQKTIQATFPNISKPNHPLKINIQSNNTDTLMVRVYKINVSAVNYYQHSTNNRGQKMIHPTAILVDSQLIMVKSSSNFTSVDTNFTLKTRDYGIYELTVSSPNSSDFSFGSFVITDLAFMNRAQNESKAALYVLNRTSGKPLPKVKVRIYEQKWGGAKYDINKKQDLVTDGKGFSDFSISKNYSNNVYFFEHGNDKYYSSSMYTFYSNPSQFNAKESNLQLFTDRSIYRPGQTIYFKGIAYEANKEKQEVLKNKAYEITLFDANNQKISTKKLTTNDFGSLAGEFVLPQSGLNGAYRIKTNNTSITVWVEEYKRPTFEVNIDMPKAEIRFGEKAMLNGNVKAYAGYSVGNATVSYRILRSVFRYCWWYSEPDKIVANGQTTTDVEGNFSISFVPKKSANNINNTRGEFYTYRLIADVTDSKGETQQGEKSFSVGEKSLFILAEVPKEIEKNADVKFDVRIETLNAEKVDKVIDYEVYKLKDLTEYIENMSTETELETEKMMLSGKWNSEDKQFNISFRNWESAQYKIIFKTLDAWGNEVKTEKSFVLFDTNDKKPAVKTYKWSQTAITSCHVGENAIIKFGTSSKNSVVLYELLQGNKVLYSQWIKFSNEIKTFKIPFKESYEGGINARFTFMKDEKLFAETFQLTRKVEIKKLSPKLSVFRDKLKPGENAEWTVSIPESAEKEKVAELMVDMYDAALDAIRPHSWSFYPAYRAAVLYSTPWNTERTSLNNDGIELPISYTEIPDIQLNTLNWFGLDFYSQPQIRPMMIRGRSPVSVVLENNQYMGAMASSKIVQDDVSLKSKIEEAEVTIQAPVKIRTNFNETAFFYPQLRTDAEGNVKFSFTVPESVTRWNVKMLAHTQDLYVGKAENQVITQKELMVQMNLPRFVRRSDKPLISATVTNLTDTVLMTTVELQLINPKTDQIIYSKISSPIPLGKGTEQQSFELNDLSTYDLLICKVVASSDSFSDGEQKYLPILPDKVLVTESLPLIIRNNETRNFSFESLIKNASNVETKQLTIEFSSNPAWYAVQALPTLSAPENDNALDLLSAYYVNSLAAYIANANPKLSKMFDQWKMGGGSREALLSNLEKNQELKNVLLQETPWVMAAQNETEQKRQIALLFDLNQQKNQSQQYLDKLLKLQTSSGGFAWFEGMPESRYITQEVLLNMARLNKLKRNTKKTISMQSFVIKAFEYLDKQISKDLDQLKKYNKNYLTENCVGDNQLFYLYLRSEYPDVPIADFAKEAMQYYTGQTEKYWTKFSLYSKAKLAILAHRNGNKALSQAILKSLKENALKTDEFGMYWAKNKSGYFWNERPIAVQTAILEAFLEINGNSSDIDEMKIWLLKQKQTQAWDSRISTVDAIYALLLRGSDWLTEESTVKIKLGNTELKPNSTEPGTGYFKETIPAADVRNEMGNVSVTSINSNAKSGIGWGAMYWQYYQDMDKLVGQIGALKVSKKLFIEKISTTGKAMLPIEQTQLKKGDKVITRLVITTDRNLEFVTLKDLRASCFEPVIQQSGCVWKENLCYYQTTKDASTQFYFSNLTKGTYVFEYELWVNNSGEFSSGMATIQCQYAPEFVSHTGGEKIVVSSP